ncbi:MAG: cupin domain-containing protein [Myxococcales bacterium]|nr:cupin domain-containing protein [Myxococcales bacterium]
MSLRASLVGAATLSRLSTLWLSAGLALGCSATAPESQYPPPGPSGGLPYIPFPEVNDLDDEVIDEDDDFGPETGAPASAKHASVSAELPASIPQLGALSECKAKTCLLRDWVPDTTWVGLKGKPATGSSAALNTPAMGAQGGPAWLWTEKIPQGNTLVLPRHQNLEYWLLGTVGKALVTGDDGGTPQGLEPWTLAHVPGGGATVRASEDSQLLIAVVTSKESLAQAIEAAKAKPWEVRWKKRPGNIERTQLNELAAVPNQGGALQVRLSMRQSARRLGALQILEGGADMRVPEHAHETEWEHVAILQGAGTLHAGPAEMELKAGSVVHLAPGGTHRFEGNGDQPVVALQIYSPPGPEARFAARTDAKTPAADPKKSAK